MTLKRASLGSILKTCLHSAGGKTARLQGFQNALFWPANRPIPLRQNFTPPFLIQWVWFDILFTWKQEYDKIWTKSCASAPMPPFWQGVDGTNQASDAHLEPETQ
jgi:hypothetical protein